MDRVPPRPTTPAGVAAPRGEPTGSGAWSLVDILIARQDWEGARTFLERLHAQSPEAARPRLIEVLLAQARASADEDAQLDLYQRVHLMDEASAEARAGVERIAKARADRALCEVPEISLASRDRKAAPPPSPVATASQPPPAIEVRDPGTDAAIRRAREAEHEARTKAEAQVASLAAERERLLEEARAADAERDRLGTLLRASVADYDRLSADLEIARTSQAGPPPARLRSRAA